jgi:zinc transporter 1/2/3
LTNEFKQGALIHSNHFSAYLLEVGVAIHSVIVGIAFGLAQTFFSSLLIALLFHQFFEGIALSAIITEARVKNQRLAFFMVGFCKLS